MSFKGTIKMTEIIINILSNKNRFTIFTPMGKLSNIFLNN